MDNRTYELFSAIKQSNGAKITHGGYWDTEAFEDSVARGIIALYEDKVVKQRGTHPADRLEQGDMLVARKHGLYVPSGSGSVVTSTDKSSLYEGLPMFSNPVHGLPIPDAIVIGFPLSQEDVNRNLDKNHYGTGYMQLEMLRRIHRLPRGVQRTGGGDLFTSAVLDVSATGKVSGEKHYVSLNRQIHPCYRSLSARGHDVGGSRSVSSFDDNPYHLQAARIQLLLELWADSVLSWSITAKDAATSVTLEANSESVKSLLYARSAPLTDSGRKRPILHLVRCHRRRVKEGIDVDVESFLRGTRQVDMGGTVFTVNPPGDFSAFVKEPFDA